MGYSTTYFTQIVFTTYLPYDPEKLLMIFKRRNQYDRLQVDGSASRHNFSGSYGTYIGRHLELMYLPILLSYILFLKFQRFFFLKPQ